MEEGYHLLNDLCGRMEIEREPQDMRQRLLTAAKHLCDNESIGFLLRSIGKGEIRAEQILPFLKEFETNPFSPPSREVTRITVTGPGGVGFAARVADVPQQLHINMGLYFAAQETAHIATVHLKIDQLDDQRVQDLLSALRKVQGVEKVFLDDKWRYYVPWRKRFTPFNPYTPRPVTGNKFKGRWEEFRRVENDLETGGAVFLNGPRRIGKTSFLLELSRRLDRGHFIPIYLHFQDHLRTITHLLRDILLKLHAAPGQQNLRIPSYSRMCEDPIQYLRDYFEQAIPPGKQLVLVIDEFQLHHEFEEDATTWSAVSRFLHYTIQRPEHQLGIVMSVCGSGSNLGKNQAFASLLSGSSTYELGYLSRSATHEVITDARVVYDQEVIDRVLELTSNDQGELCNPHFVQLICHRLNAKYPDALHISSQMLNDWLVVDLPDVRREQFEHMWGVNSGLDPRAIKKCHLLLTTIADLSKVTPWVGLGRLVDAPSHSLSASDCEQILRTLLELRSIEARHDGFSQAYRIKAEIVTRWLQRNYYRT